jgi:hypothetical protein
MIAADQRSLVGSERASHDGARVDVERRSVTAGQIGDGDVFDEEGAVATGDVGRSGQRRHRGTDAELAGAEAADADALAEAAFTAISGPFWPQAASRRQVTRAKASTP